MRSSIALHRHCSTKSTACTNRFLEFKRNQNDWFRSTYRFMLDVPQRDFLSWLRERRQSLLHNWECLKNVYSSENDAQLWVQRRIATFSEVRVPPDWDDSDDSYSPSVSVWQCQTQMTSRHWLMTLEVIPNYLLELFWAAMSLWVSLICLRESHLRLKWAELNGTQPEQSQ